MLKARVLNETVMVKLGTTTVEQAKAYYSTVEEK